MSTLEQARAVRGRVAPIGVIGGSSRVVEHNLYVYRRLWPMFVTGFFEPVFDLLGIGFGIGGLVGTITVGGEQFSYGVYVAPALMGVGGNERRDLRRHVRALLPAQVREDL